MVLKQKDTMWHIKTWIEVIQIFIFMVCLIGFVGSFIIMLVSIPVIWEKPISYQPLPWLNCVMAWSMGIGLPNFLCMLSCDKEWRRDYRDEKDAEKFDWVKSYPARVRKFCTDEV